MELEEEIEEFINKSIRPKARVDGGDLKFERYESGTVFIGAYAECSTCVCCGERLGGWIKDKLKEELGVNANVRFIKHVPYFKKV